MNADALRWLLGLERLGMKFGLENMTKLAAELGEPHRRFASVLVAGTNGKGSVTAVVEATLRAAGYRSARYTSPHLVRLEERFFVDGREVDTGALETAVVRVRLAVDALLAREALGSPPTFFECTTAAAFELFAASSVEIAVLEVGLGGRLDATNIVAPLVCAITTIAVDHQAQLGSTLESIAFEKAGIIKAGAPVIIGRLPAAAEAVVETVARQSAAPLVRALEVATLPSGVRPALAGAHQRDNALVAIAVLDALAGRGFPVDESAIRQGIEGVHWPGRLERRRYEGCDVLLDAAHNPAGAQALAAYLRDSHWTDATLVFAAMADKDAQGMLAALVPWVGRIICTTAETARAQSARVLADLAASVDPAKTIEIVEVPEAALRRACTRSSRVVIAGSMFLIGPLRGILR